MIRVILAALGLAAAFTGWPAAALGKKLDCRDQHWINEQVGHCPAAGTWYVAPSNLPEDDPDYGLVDAANLQLAIDNAVAHETIVLLAGTHVFGNLNSSPLDADHDWRVDEDPLDGIDNDGDGRIDEDGVDDDGDGLPARTIEVATASGETIIFRRDLGGGFWPPVGHQDIDINKPLTIQGQTGATLGPAERLPDGRPFPATATRLVTTLPDWTAFENPYDVFAGELYCGTLVVNAVGVTIENLEMVGFHVPITTFFPGFVIRHNRFVRSLMGPTFMNEYEAVFGGDEPVVSDYRDNIEEQTWMIGHEMASAIRLVNNRFEFVRGLFMFTWGNINNPVDLIEECGLPGAGLPLNLDYSYDNEIIGNEFVVHSGIGAADGAISMHNHACGNIWGTRIIGNTFTMPSTAFDVISASNLGRGDSQTVGGFTITHNRFNMSAPASELIHLWRGVTDSEVAYNQFIAAVGDEGEVLDLNRYFFDGCLQGDEWICQPEWENDIFGVPPGNVMGYAYVDVWNHGGARTVMLGLSSDDSVQVRVNGEEVWTNEIARPSGPPDSELWDRVELPLATGLNQLVFKVFEGGGDFSLWGRLEDAAGLPILSSDSLEVGLLASDPSGDVPCGPGRESRCTFEAIEVGATQGMFSEFLVVGPFSNPGGATPGLDALNADYLGSLGLSESSYIAAEDDGFSARVPSRANGPAGGIIVGPDAFGWPPFPSVWHQDTTTDAPERGVLWCGRDDASWVFSPGYGNNWDEAVYKDFDLDPGPVGLTYSLRYDAEWGFDVLRVQASFDGGQTYDDLLRLSGVSGELTNDGTLVLEEHFGVTVSGPDPNGQGFITVHHDLPDFAGGPLLLRFRFTSDGDVSDEDGLLDSLYGAAQIDFVELTSHDVTTSLDVTVRDDFNDGPDGWVAENRPDAKVYSSHNHIHHNQFGRFSAYSADVYLGQESRDNTVEGQPGTRVLDHGVNNTVQVK